MVKLKEESHYTNNKKDGLTHEFDEVGMLITILKYKNGFLLEREKLNRKDDKGLKQGLWHTYFDNGKLKSEGYYENDMLNGSFQGI